MARTNEKKFTFEGEINGNLFKQVISLPDDTGGGNQGGGDGAHKGGTFVVFGPVIFVANDRRAPQRKA
jgi:hypothetical protein